ncbi:MAG: hypothetical protein QXT99_07535 [Candidatus Nitrosotenuis sp.]
MKTIRNNITQSRFSKKVLLSSILAIVSFTIFIAATYLPTNNIVKDDTSIESTSKLDDVPQWNPQRTKTGEVHLLALEINPEQNYNEVVPRKLPLDKNTKTILNENPDLDAKNKAVYKKVAFGNIRWLDATIDNAGKNTKIDEESLYEFYQYTADGNTDFKVVFKDGSTKFYRLYFMEVP